MSLMNTHGAPQLAPRANLSSCHDSLNTPSGPCTARVAADADDQRPSLSQMRGSKCRPLVAIRRCCAAWCVQGGKARLKRNPHKPAVRPLCGSGRDRAFLDRYRGHLPACWVASSGTCCAGRDWVLAGTADRLTIRLPGMVRRTLFKSSPFVFL